MTLKTQLKDKHILVLGLGLTGLSCVRFLTSQGLTIAVNDSRENIVDPNQFSIDYPEVSLFLGSWDQAQIATADIIIASPGIDLEATGIRQHISEKCQVWGDVELFFQTLKARNLHVPTLAVTGSNGKSTVVSLLAHIGNKLGLTVCLAGNIGTPILDLLSDNKIVTCDALILELSSFQLETVNSMQANGATVLNISDDHLDRHKTLACYQQIKQKIYQQTEKIIFNRDDSLSKPVANGNAQAWMSFGSDAPQDNNFGLGVKDDKLQLMYGEQVLVAVNDLSIAGTHNALNCLAALALGQSVNWPLAAMVKTLSSFTGLAHRCQVVASEDGITWINDSKATNVGSTLAALVGLADTKQATQQLILIAGGEGKGADFSPLQDKINKEVSLLITLGKDADKLAKLTEKSVKTDNLITAVKLAQDYAKAGDIVLLSPACASLDMFKNFVERGNIFTQAVQVLTSKSADKEAQLLAIQYPQIKEEMLNDQ